MCNDKDSLADLVPEEPKVEITSDDEDEELVDAPVQIGVDFADGDEATVVSVHGPFPPPAAPDVTVMHVQATVEQAEGIPQPGEQIDGQGAEPAEYLDEGLESPDQFLRRIKSPLVEKMNNIKPPPVGPIPDPPLAPPVQHVVPTDGLHTAIRKYQAGLAKGLSPESSFFESGLHGELVKY